MKPPYPSPRVPHRALARALACLGLGCGGASGTGPAHPPAGPPVVEPAPVVDADFLTAYAATRGFRLGEPRAIAVTPDGTKVLFLRSDARSFVQNLYELDLASGAEREVLSATTLLGGSEESLSAEERARRERLRLAARGIATFELSRDGTKVLVPLSGTLYVVDRTTGRVRELRSEAGYPDDPRLSPDGSKVACVRGGDLYVVDLETGHEARLTTDASATVTNGLAEFVAQEEMGRFEGYWWSPDSATLLYQQTDVSGVETLHVLDPLHPEAEPSSARYPRAGRDNARVRLGFVAATGGPTRWLAWDAGAFPYLTGVTWSAHRPPLLTVQNRAQTDVVLLEVNPDSLATMERHVEHDDAWVNLDTTVPELLDRAGHFLWVSERTGTPTLEVRSLVDRALARRLWSSELSAEALLHVSQDGSTAWFRGTEGGGDTHVYRVAIDGGSGPERVTSEPGEHDGTFAEGTDVWVDRVRPRRGAARFVVRRGDEVVAELRSVAEPPPWEPLVEWRTVGERRYRTAIVRPRSFEPGQRYPVILSVYAGPLFRKVSGASSAFLIDQWYANHGYVVVSADGRGTPGRGRAWERAIKGDLITVALADQIDALQALAAECPELDLRRVGVFGWSFGGYFSAMAALLRPDVFHAAIAGAPVTDWADYDTHYTERYLGLPAENDAGYTQSSAVAQAPRLTRPLLLIHGTADDNVYFLHSIKLSNALLRAGRSHDFLPLSGFTHMVADPEMTRSLHQRNVEFFGRHLMHE